MTGGFEIIQKQNCHHTINLCTTDEEVQSATTTADNYSESQGMNISPCQPPRQGAANDTILSLSSVLESCHEIENMPIPVLLGGKEVDLGRLYDEVMACGGYEKCADTAMWSVISTNLGFGENCGPGLKLLYVKCFDKSPMLDSSQSSPLVCVDLCSTKSGEESSTGIVESDLAGSGGSISSDSHGNSHQSNGDIPAKRRRVSYCSEEHASGSSVCESRVPTSKEIDTFIEAIGWLKQIALNPGDPKQGQGVRESKKNEAWVKKCLSVANKIRAVLWGRKEMIYPGSSLSKQKIPPALYYKELPKPNKRALEKLRANQARAIKCGLHLQSNPIDLQAPQATFICQSPKQQTSGWNNEQDSQYSGAYMKSMAEALTLGNFLSKNDRKRIPIGYHFQAQVPPWNGKPVSESNGRVNSIKCADDAGDYRGGSRIWPLSGSLDLTKHDKKVGRGRPLFCSCTSHMSVECVRKHVLEQREKKKQELHEAFTLWGFNDMGETVSEDWTKNEEIIFDQTVRMNPLSLGKNFWDELPAALPSKTMAELVSYYFNVFVVRRRAIENRIAPESIDSDDDEKELQTSGCNSTIIEKIAMKDETPRKKFLLAPSEEASTSICASYRKAYPAS